MPNELLCRSLVFFLQGGYQEDSGITAKAILFVQFLQLFQVSFQFRNESFWKGNRPFFSSFSIMDNEKLLIKIEVVNPELETLKKPETATIQQFYDQIVRGRQMGEARINLFNRVQSLLKLAIIDHQSAVFL